MSRDRKPRKPDANDAPNREFTPDEWQAAVDLSDAEDALQRGGGSHFIRMMRRKRDAAAHKIAPGAKARAIERNRLVVAAMHAEIRAGETNLTRIVEHVRRVTGVRMPPITARRLLKSKFKLAGKAGRPKNP